MQPLMLKSETDCGFARRHHRRPRFLRVDGLSRCQSPIFVISASISGIASGAHNRDAVTSSARLNQPNGFARARCSSCGYQLSLSYELAITA
jgi:hypothetical protein